VISDALSFSSDTTRVKLSIRAASLLSVPSKYCFADSRDDEDELEEEGEKEEESDATEALEDAELPELRGKIKRNENINKRMLSLCNKKRPV
jgi:hypothetical protein